MRPTVFILILLTLAPTAQTQGQTMPDDQVNLHLPPVIYASPGVETNVYFDNVVRVINPDNYVFRVICSIPRDQKPSQYKERWAVTPTTAKASDHSFVLEVINQANVVIARQESILRIAPIAAGAGRSVSMLMIGDSLTHNSIYPQRVLDLCQGKSNPKITLIGSFRPGGVKLSPEMRHEGYGGWTAKTFATSFRKVARTGHYKQRGSPFIYKDKDGKGKLNFARYCDEFNQGKGPDVVTIFLGPNDIYRIKRDNVEPSVNAIIKHFETLVNMIHKLRKDTAIGMVLTLPSAQSQDALSHDGTASQWQYKVCQRLLVKKLTQRFGGLEKQNIYIIGANLNIDCAHNYPVSESNWSAHHDEKIIRQNNAVHPAKSGYMQIGDSIYSWLKVVMAKK